MLALPPATLCSTRAAPVWLRMLNPPLRSSTSTVAGALPLFVTVNVVRRTLPYGWNDCTDVGVTEIRAALRAKSSRRSPLAGTLALLVSDTYGLFVAVNWWEPVTLEKSQ